MCAIVAEDMSFEEVAMTFPRHTMSKVCLECDGDEDAGVSEETPRRSVNTAQQ